MVIGALVLPAVFFLGFYALLAEITGAAGIDYAQYLTPAILVQITLFAGIASAAAISSDVGAGLVDRLRSMPVAALAPVLGRLAADLVRAGITTVVVLTLGALFGFRFGGGPWAIAGFVAIVVAFAVVSSLTFDAVALRSRDPEATAASLQALGMPLVMLSTAFVPAALMPAAVGGVVAHLPVSVVIDALRDLATGAGVTATVVEAVVWLAGLLVLSLAWGARAFRRAR